MDLVWNQGKVLPSTSALWTSGIVTPIDCGAKEGTITGRKLRPITLTEHLVKLAESVGLMQQQTTSDEFSSPTKLE